MKKVLIVDDSPTTRAVVKVYLSGQSLVFLEADNGTDAMRCNGAFRVTWNTSRAPVFGPAPSPPPTTNTRSVAASSLG